MKKYDNSLKISTFFDDVYYPVTVDELRKIIENLKSASKKYIIVGNTTNTLFRNRYSNLTIISLSKMSKKYSVNNGIVSVSSNYSTIRLAVKLQKLGFNNLNFLSGIPGTIGGNIVMNAGCYGYEIGEQIENVTILDENHEVAVIPRSRITFGYRFSSLMDKNIVILSANIKISVITMADISYLNKERMIAQPVEARTLGSIFMNPYNHKVWKLLDDVGLRGFRIGKTSISQKHPNFIISEDGSTSEEYAKLIELAQKMVYLKYRVRLNREVMIYD